MTSTADNISVFRQSLMRWWELNARDYPWRHNRTPYQTAIAELMLRRTQAKQVIPVFEAFLRKWPSLREASQANPDEIRTVLFPLGLAWRAGSIIAFLGAAYERYGGELPTDANALKDLPGVGDYVSNAIACFSGNKAVPLIDTNVVRVLGRIFGVRTDGEARRRVEMKQLAALCVPNSGPAEYHYAALDFAALVCLAQRPRCSSCPMMHLCIYAKCKEQANVSR